MIINNQKQAVTLRIQKTLALLFLVIAIGLVYFTNLLIEGVGGLNRDQVAGIAAGLVVLFFLYHFMRNHNYIYYSDTGNKFILRYFSLNPMAGNKKSIEFNKSELNKFELKRFLSGFTESIIIYRYTSQGIAKYPPVSLTALSKSDKEKLFASLQKLINANQAGR